MKTFFRGCFPKGTVLCKSSNCRQMIDPNSEYEEFAFLSPDVKPPLKKYWEDVNRKEESRLIPCIGSISVRDSQTASY